MPIEKVREVFSEGEHSYRIKVALDGLPAAGKTTVVNRLMTEGDNLITVGEFSVFAQKPVAPKTIEDAKSNVLLFVKVEMDRKQKLDELLIGSQQVDHVILDKSFLSPLAFEYAVVPQRGYDICDWAIDQMLGQKTKIIIPTQILVLDVSPVVAEVRRIGSTRMGLYYKDGFPERYKEFFQIVQSLVPSLVYFIDANQPFPQVANNVLKLINELNM